MKIKYLVKNLVDACNEGNSIVVATTSDLAFGAGVAKEVSKAFNCRYELKDYSPATVGECFTAHNDTVYVLCNKQGRYDILDIDDLKLCFDSLRQVFTGKELYMPKIGCGRDRLDWEDVLESLQDTFNEDDITINVCVLSNADIPETDEEATDDVDSDSPDLTLETDELIMKDKTTGDIVVDKQIFDDFAENKFITIEFVGGEYDGQTNMYKMFLETANGIVMRFIGNVKYGA